MAEYYDRRYSLEVDDKPFIVESSGYQFRVTFNILHDYGGYTSYADIQIYGLSRATEAKVFKEGQVIAFRAGYADTGDYIFKGELINLLRDKQGADRITRLICRSGTQRDTASINKTLGKNVTLTEIIKECAGAIGLPLVINEQDFESLKPYSRGKCLTGSPDEILKQLSKAWGFNYIIENDKIVITGKGSFRGGSIVPVSQFTGMVGQPEITEQGADVVVRMNPKIKIGGRFEIKSEYKTFNFNNAYYQDIKESDGLGVYRIFRINHTGDTHGDDWNTKITGIR